MKPDLKKRWLSDYESYGNQQVQQLKRGTMNEEGYNESLTNLNDRYNLNK